MENDAQLQEALKAPDIFLIIHAHGENVKAEDPDFATSMENVRDVLKVAVIAIGAAVLIGVCVIIYEKYCKNSRVHPSSVPMDHIGSDVSNAAEKGENKDRATVAEHKSEASANPASAVLKAQIEPWQTQEQKAVGAIAAV